MKKNYYKKSIAILMAFVMFASISFFIGCDNEIPPQNCCFPSSNCSINICCVGGSNCSGGMGITAPGFFPPPSFWTNFNCHCICRLSPVILMCECGDNSFTCTASVDISIVKHRGEDILNGVSDYYAVMQVRINNHRNFEINLFKSLFAYSFSGRFFEIQYIVDGEEILFGWPPPSGAGTVNIEALTIAANSKFATSIILTPLATDESEFNSNIHLINERANIFINVAFLIPVGYCFCYKRTWLLMRSNTYEFNVR